MTLTVHDDDDEVHEGIGSWYCLSIGIKIFTQVSHQSQLLVIVTTLMYIISSVFTK